jgi:hypothetical protein
LPGPQNTGLELFSLGGSLKIVSMTVHSLKSAWPHFARPPYWDNNTAR